MALERMLMGSVLWALAVSAQAVDGTAVLTQGGSQPGAMPCVACHGADGAGLAAAGFPRLAGLPADYLRKQLADFKSGARSQAVMQPLAAALTEEEINAVTDTLAAMPTPPFSPAPRSAMPTDAMQKLALQGAWERQVPACVSCHGPGGAGVGAAFPPLAGQPAMYLAAQLTAWQSGTRRNDPNDLMGHIARSLTTEEVQGVATYFASLTSQEAK